MTCYNPNLTITQRCDKILKMMKEKRSKGDTRTKLDVNKVHLRIKVFQSENDLKSDNAICKIRSWQSIHNKKDRHTAPIAIQQVMHPKAFCSHTENSMVVVLANKVDDVR